VRTSSLASDPPMALHFGTVQVVAAVVFAVLALAFAVVFVVVAAKSRSDIPFEEVQGPGYWLRKRWLAVLVVVLTCVLGISFFELPYPGRAARPTTVVKVTGGQFFWSLAPDRVRAGTRVRFDVTSVDVNHGFGLYDPHGHLLGSVQAMPEYHNKLDLTLDDPGRYLIRCLEFCGLNHATMQGTFQVVGR
jgi:cytochrome c oxidase subunit II